MEDKVKNTSIIKGRTKIELFNKNGELEYAHEEDNAFSPYWARFFNSSLMGGLTSTYDYAYAYPVVTHMQTYNTELTEAEIFSNVNFKKSEILGIADVYKTYSGSDPKYGTVNNIETDYTIVDFDKGKSYAKYVCDFPAGVATGTFNTVSLANTDKTITFQFKEAKSKKVETNLNLGTSITSSEANYGKSIMKGEYIIVQKNKSGDRNFYVLNKQFDLVRMVNAPSTSYNYTFLDLEPDNNDVIYIQQLKSSSNGDIYKWTLSTDNIELVKNWTKTFFSSIRLKHEGQDAIGLLEAGTSSPSTFTGYNVYIYDSSDMSYGASSIVRVESNSPSSGTVSDFYTTNVHTVKKSNGEYGYFVVRQGGCSYYESFEDLSTSKDHKYNNYIGYCLGVFFNEADGCITAYCLHRSMNTSKNLLIVRGSTPFITANKLSAPVTKSAEQALRITYSLEVDM